MDTLGPGYLRHDDFDILTGEVGGTVYSSFNIQTCIGGDDNDDYDILYRDLHFVLKKEGR